MRLGSSSAGSIVPLEVAPLRLLVVLMVAEGDLVGGWRGAAGVDFTVATTSAVISAMMSSKFFLAVGV